MRRLRDWCWMSVNVVARTAWDLGVAPPVAAIREVNVDPAAYEESSFGRHASPVGRQSP